jgi:hypothetical protein
MIETRRSDVIRLGRAGLDYLDVRGDGRTLIVAFFGRLPAQLGREHFVIEGGRRITAIAITSIHIAPAELAAERAVALRLDRAGDDSTYRLRIVGHADVDVLYAALPFTFNAAVECPDDGDDDEPAGPFAMSAAPHRDGRPAADLDVTLDERLEHLSDDLRRFQDAVAAEAYLATARRRTSVRRHARLLDYAMHEGSNARAWICLSADTDIGPIDSRDVVFSTTATTSTPAEYFEPIGADALYVSAAQSPMQLYAWGNHTCLLEAGATAATLRDAWEPANGAAEPQRALRQLAPGAHVLFESVPEVAGANSTAADPARRHVVRLTAVRRAVDPLYGIPIVEIGWEDADRLPFKLPVATSVAWGNLVAVDHGRSLDERETLPAVPLESHTPYRPVLAHRNLTFAKPPPAGPAANFNRRDPRNARPQIIELVTTDRAGCRRDWSAVSDLLASGPDDAHYVAEVDENGLTTVRFGDGVLGRRPPRGATVHARYRVGNGVAGNVGADTIVNVTFTGEPAGPYELRVRNPLPAHGGTAAEAADDVRLLAPSSVRALAAAAITPDDYGRIAERDPRIRRAAAQFCWTGSRTVVRVAIDPVAAANLDPDLLREVAFALEAVRRIGHEVQVVAAVHVPLRLVLNVRVKRGFTAEAVRKALAGTLSAKQRPDGTRGFFHPESLAFGGGIAQSALVARALAVAGVEDVTIARFERLNAPAPRAVPAVLRLGPLELGRLDGDPSRPGRGVLALQFR